MSRDPFEDHPIVLSEEDQARVQAWVDRVKPMLGLSDWAIRVTRHKAEKHALASSYLRDEADQSTIALDATLADADPEELRQTLTHELIHCHLQPGAVLVQKLIDGELGTRTEAVIQTAARIIEERTIDRLATAVARFLPLVETT